MDERVCRGLDATEQSSRSAAFRRRGCPATWANGTTWEWICSFLTRICCTVKYFMVAKQRPFWIFKLKNGVLSGSRRFTEKRHPFLYVNDKLSVIQVNNLINPKRAMHCTVWQREDQITNNTNIHFFSTASWQEQSALLANIKIQIQYNK